MTEQPKLTEDQVVQCHLWSAAWVENHPDEVMGLASELGVKLPEFEMFRKGVRIGLSIMAIKAANAGIVVDAGIYEQITESTLVQACEPAGARSG